MAINTDGLMNAVGAVNNDNKPKRGLNFISPGIDKVGNILQWMLTWGLALTAVVILTVIITSFYEYKLQTEVKAVTDSMAVTANQLEAMGDFENKFIATQEKLYIYSDINDNEKMVELFPILSALTPEGIQVKDLIIMPSTVEIVCFVVDQEALTRFVMNLKQANGMTFEDGQKLTLGNPNVPEIAQTTNYMYGGIVGYNLTVDFEYRID